MTVIGVGLDIVDIESYSTQLKRPGTTMRTNFTSNEWTDAHNVPNVYASLAGRWAAKEATIKAWSSSRYGQNPKVSPHLVKYNEIEVVTDVWRRPKIRLHGEFANHMANLKLFVSISHDGNIAAATVIIEE